MLVVVVLVSLLLAVATAISCSEFDPKKISLVTLDVFAALMDTETSLDKSVSQILPRLSASEVDSLVNQWMNAYGGYAGTVFNETVTGPSPFQWMLSTTLDSIDTSMKLNLSKDEHDALIAAWGNLIPWPATKETLQKLHSAGISTSPLSNGDVTTLTNAMGVFLPEVPMKFIFSSDFPVGSFKPDSRMYAQLLQDHGVTVEQVLHVAGAPSDAQGARQYGLFAALVYNTPIPGQYKPCFALKNITELSAVLGL